MVLQVYLNMNSMDSILNYCVFCGGGNCEGMPVHRHNLTN